MLSISQICFTVFLSLIFPIVKSDSVTFYESSTDCSGGSSFSKSIDYNTGYTSLISSEAAIVQNSMEVKLGESAVIIAIGTNGYTCYENNKGGCYNLVNTDRIGKIGTFAKGAGGCYTLDLE